MTRNGLIQYLTAYLQAKRASWEACYIGEKVIADHRCRKLKARGLLPENCDSEETIEFLICCLKERRANTLQEAIDLWKCIPGKEDI